MLPVPLFVFVLCLLSLCLPEHFKIYNFLSLKKLKKILTTNMDPCIIIFVARDYSDENNTVMRAWRNWQTR